MPQSSQEWINSLPESLSHQKYLLAAITKWCSEDQTAAWLVVGCSLARGDADALSDIDIAIGVDSGLITETVLRLRDAAVLFDNVIASYSSTLTSVPSRVERLFVQYSNRAQLDIAVCDASNSTLPDCVVLYDPRSLVHLYATEPTFDATQTEEWLFSAWEALLHFGKYYRRNSLWEAHEQLETTRRHYWQLCAACYSVINPEHGITSILDANLPQLTSERVSSTVSSLEKRGVMQAAVQLAHLLREAQDTLDLVNPVAAERLGLFVMNDLDELNA